MATNGAIVQRKKSLASLAPASTVEKGKPGRKPAGKSKSVEHQAAVTEWSLTPERMRKPSTQKELAAKLGITEKMVSYYMQKSPRSIGAFVEEIEQRALAGDYPDILDKMSQLARKGHPEMSKLFMRQIVEPRRIEQQKGSHMMDDPALQQTLRVLLRGGEETIAVEATASVGNGQPRSQQSKNVQFSRHEDSSS